MLRKKFTEAQIAVVVRELENGTVQRGQSWRLWQCGGPRSFGWSRDETGADALRLLRALSPTKDLTHRYGSGN